MIYNLIVSLLIYLNFSAQGGSALGGQFLNWHFLSVIFFIIWWIMNASLAEKFLEKIFTVEKIYTKALGYFLSLFILVFIANIFTAWFVLNNLTICLAMILSFFVLWFWQKLFKKYPITSYQLPVTDYELKPLFNISKKKTVLMFLCFLVFLIIGWLLIFFARTGNYIQSPWEVLSPWYVLVCILAIFLTYILIFVRKSGALILIIILSLLLHSYLLVYQTGFGGDKWRHLGSEYRILNGIEYQPTLLTNNLWYQKVLGVNVPRALVDGPKLSYGFQWSLSVIFSKVTSIDLYYLDQYLGLILFSIFVPLMFFIGAFQIKPDKKFALLMAIVSLLFYPLGYYGSQTLPAGYGAMSFIFILILWIVWLNNFKFKILNLKLLSGILFLTVLMYFGYSLALILALMVGILALLIRSRSWIKYVGVFILSVSIFVIEYLTSLNSLSWPASLSVLKNTLVQQNNFLYYGAGEWLKFQFSGSRMVSEIFGVIFCVLILVFIWQAIKSKNRPVEFLALGLMILVINFILSWTFLSGLHILSRRLDVFVAILAVFVFAWGIYINFIERKKYSIVVIIFLTVLTTITYISGPVLNANVTQDEVMATKYIWSQIKSEPQNYCVLANTWPLLALEAWSAKEVVAGNFFNDFNHQQPERVALFDAINKNSSRIVLNEALFVTKKEKCFLMVDEAVATEVSTNEIYKLLGEPQKFGSNLVWRF